MHYEPEVAHRLNLSSEGFKLPPRGREAGRDLTLIRQIKVFSVGLIIIQRAVNTAVHCYGSCQHNAGGNRLKD